MIVTLHTERIRTIEQIAAFVEANEPVIFNPWTGPAPTRSWRGR